MKRFELGLLVLAVATTTLGASAAADKQPFETIRDLQQLQDHIATGDAIAQAAHAKAIDRTARLFGKAKSSTWGDPRNTRALVVYLFSGGNAAIIADTISESTIAPVHRTLYLGALAYGLGDDDKARRQLLPIDAKSLPGGIGAQLALVQATLCADTETTKAISLLDLARLLAPGTLIEEAALRKEMSLIGAKGDLDKYGLLARRYIGAYSHSMYADNFRQLVAATAVQMGSADSEEAGRRIAKLVITLDKPERRKIYLAIAREAVLSGRIKMATMASEEAGRLSQGGLADETRAMVYFGAAAIVGDRYEIGHKALTTALAERLGTKDQALRTSALAVAEMIRRPPVAGEAGIEAKHAGVVADAERALLASDETLKRAGK